MVGPGHCTNYPGPVGALFRRNVAGPPQPRSGCSADSNRRLVHLLATTAVWYIKSQPTFSDTIALVRRYLWASSHFSMSVKNQDSIEIPQDLYHSIFKFFFRLTGSAKMSVCAQGSRHHFHCPAAVYRSLRRSPGPRGQNPDARTKTEWGAAGLAEVLSDGRAADQHGVLEGVRASGAGRLPAGGAVVDVPALEGDVG
jgi:hypothetical protein